MLSLYGYLQKQITFQIKDYSCMKKFTFATLLCCAVSSVDMYADNTISPADSSIFKNMLLNEVVVVSNPKLNQRVFESPVSIPVFSAERIDRQNILSIKNISAGAPTCGQQACRGSGEGMAGLGCGGG